MFSQKKLKFYFALEMENKTLSVEENKLYEYWLHRRHIAIIRFDLTKVLAFGKSKTSQIQYNLKYV